MTHRDLTIFHSSMILSTNAWASLSSGEMILSWNFTKPNIKLRSRTVDHLHSYHKTTLGLKQQRISSKNYRNWRNKIGWGRDKSRKNTARCKGRILGIRDSWSQRLHQLHQRGSTAWIMRSLQFLKMWNGWVKGASLTFKLLILRGWNPQSLKLRQSEAIRMRQQIWSEDLWHYFSIHWNTLATWANSTEEIFVGESLSLILRLNLTTWSPLLMTLHIRLLFLLRSIKSVKIVLSRTRVHPCRLVLINHATQRISKRCKV